MPNQDAATKNDLWLWPECSITVYVAVSFVLFHSRIKSIRHAYRL